MRRTFAVLEVALWLLAAIPAGAHHAEFLYDMNNPVSLDGVVTKVEWGNPHVYLHVDVKGNAEAATWTLELKSINSLKRDGWTTVTVKPGDRVTCTGGRAKGGARAMRCATVTLTDGRKLKS